MKKAARSTPIWLILLLIIPAALILFILVSFFWDAPAKGDSVPSDNATLSSDTKEVMETSQPFNDYYNETFFDVYYTHKPTADDVDQMSNMLTSEDVPMQTVIDILGKPHNFGPTQGVTTLEWETQENGTIHVYVTLPVEIYEQEGEGANYVALLMEYGYAYSMSSFDISITQ